MYVRVYSPVPEGSDESHGDIGQPGKGEQEEDGHGDLGDTYLSRLLLLLLRSHGAEVGHVHPLGLGSGKEEEIKGRVLSVRVVVVVVVDGGLRLISGLVG